MRIVETCLSSDAADISVVYKYHADFSSSSILIQHSTLTPTVNTHIHAHTAQHSQSSKNNMGGRVFSTVQADGHPTIETPRMSPSNYYHLKCVYGERLTTHFSPDTITSPPEAPGKQTYGDIDFNVASNDPLDWAEVARGIGACAWYDRGGQKASFAIRLDGQRSSQIPVQYFKIADGSSLGRETSPESSDEISNETYAQLDLDRIDPALKEWATLYYSYGDAAAILGNAVTNLGFDLTDKGLRLRLQELDEAKQGELEYLKPAKEDGIMMLSSDPLKVMEFFGLSTDRHSEGFTNEEELFQWLSECPATTEQCLRRERRQKSMDGRAETRLMFRRFYTEWLPAHLEQKRMGSTTATATTTTTTDAEIVQSCSTLPEMRKQVLDGCFDSLPVSDMRAIYLAKSLDFFNKREQYMKVYLAFVRKRGNKIAEEKFRAMLVTHSRKEVKSDGLKELVRAFRRNAFYDEKIARPGLLAHSVTDVDSQLFTFLDESGRELRDRERVNEWVKQNFDHVKFVERERVKARKG